MIIKSEGNLHKAIFVCFYHKVSNPMKDVIVKNTNQILAKIHNHQHKYIITVQWKTHKPNLVKNITSKLRWTCLDKLHGWQWLVYGTTGCCRYHVKKNFTLLINCNLNSRAIDLQISQAKRKAVV